MGGEGRERFSGELCAEVLSVVRGSAGAVRDRDKWDHPWRESFFGGHAARRRHMTARSGLFIFILDLPPLLEN